MSPWNEGSLAKERNNGFPWVQSGAGLRPSTGATGTYFVSFAGTVEKETRVIFTRSHELPPPRKHKLLQDSGKQFVPKSQTSSAQWLVGRLSVFNQTSKVHTKKAKFIPKKHQREKKGNPTPRRKNKKKTTGMGVDLCEGKLRQSPDDEEAVAWKKKANGEMSSTPASMESLEHRGWFKGGVP